MLAFHPCTGVGGSEGDAGLMLAGHWHCSCPHLRASRRCHQAGRGRQGVAALVGDAITPLRPTEFLQAGWKMWLSSAASVPSPPTTTLKSDLQGAANLPYCPYNLSPSFPALPP